MTLETVLLLLGLAALAAGLSFVSAVALARFAGAPAAVLPWQRLRGWDFLIAGALFFGGQNAAQELIPQIDGVHPVARMLLIALGAGLIAWLYLGAREGSLAPRRAPVLGRKVREVRNVLTCYLLALPGFLAVTYFNRHLFLALTDTSPSQQIAQNWAELAPGALALTLILAVLILPLLEEALFRGYLWRFLAGRPEFGPRRALALTALLFALAHDPTAWLPVLYLGGLFGWVYWRSGKLRYAVMAHALHNGFAAAATLMLPNSATDALS